MHLQYTLCGYLFIILYFSYALDFIAWMICTVYFNGWWVDEKEIKLVNGKLGWRNKAKLLRHEQDCTKGWKVGCFSKCTRKNYVSFVKEEKRWRKKIVLILAIFWDFPYNKENVFLSGWHGETRNRILVLLMIHFLGIYQTTCTDRQLTN